MGSLFAAIPLATATRIWRQQPLLLFGDRRLRIQQQIGGAVRSFPVIFVAGSLGAAAGRPSALVAGYAGR